MKSVKQILENHWPEHIVQHSPRMVFGSSDPIHMNFVKVNGVFIGCRHFSPAKRGDKPLIFYKEFKRYTFCGYNGNYIVYDKIHRRQDNTNRQSFKTKNECIAHCEKILNNEYTKLS